MTETASVLTLQTPENYLPNSVGRMIGGIDAKVVDENGNGMYSFCSTESYTHPVIG